MTQKECIELLQWCLPLLRMRWAGFRRVRSQVCKRIARRVRGLGLENCAAYRRYLESNTAEWAQLDAMCRITISRFYRDRVVFETLGAQVLPALVVQALERGDNRLKAWSCGCASGEEPYSLSLLWLFRAAPLFPGMDFKIVATDADPKMLERAREGIYNTTTIRDLPEDFRGEAFEELEGRFQIRPGIRERVSWRCGDVRREAPAGPFDLILCRNLVLTYFDSALQQEVMERIFAALRPGGALVIGSHEHLPQTVECKRWCVRLPIYRRLS